MADNSQKHEDHISRVCGLTREEIDELYSPSAWCKRMPRPEVIAEFVRRCTEASDKAKAKLSGSIGVPYGSSESQKIDVLTNKSTPDDAPIFVFLHGGFWLELSRYTSSGMAIPLVEAGAKVVAVGYDLAPKVSIDQIVQQIREAFVYIIQMALQSNSRGIYLSGHSAGAHLVVMALDDQLRQMLSTTENYESIIKGAFLLGGVYDLRPLVFSSKNSALKLTTDSAWKLSPVNPDNVVQLTSLWPHLRLALVIGENDSPEFREQAEHYRDLLGGSGRSVQFLDVPRLDHFDMIERLEEPDFVLIKEILEFMMLRRE